MTLDGSGSLDSEGDPLSYSWLLSAKPGGSAAALSGATTANPTFDADVEGTYPAQLIVNDGSLGSAADSVTITVTPAIDNAVPVANAGTYQRVEILSLVTLDGSGSSDADSDSLTYNWSITSKPALSTAVLTGATTANPTFTADLEGTYTVQLIVNDANVDSSPSSVTIMASRWSTTNIIGAPAGVGPHCGLDGHRDDRLGRGG